MASVINVNVQPEKSDSNQSAMELLKPDPPIEIKAEEKVDEEDELEALRLAALNSIKPKKSTFKVQAHPVRSNLLSIVPVEPEVAKKPALIVSKQPPPVISSKTSKFDRGRDSDRSSVDLSDSEEEIEVEEEVTATESEGENGEESEKKPESDEKSQTNEAAPEKSVKKQISIEPDDVLNVDCTDEVDEFTNFLNDLDKPAEEEKKSDEKKDTTKAKKKKTKIILVKKKVKKNRDMKKQPLENPPPRPRSRSPRSRLPLRSRSPRFRSRSRSPHIRWRSPRRRYTPPPRRHSPYRRSSRSPSPYRRRRSPHSPRRYRPRSPRSPRSYRRRYSRSPEPARGGSAPRQTRARSRSNSKEPLKDKSKSLPPQDKNDAKNANKKKELTEEEENDEKLKRLPTPEREKLLQRRKKFEGNQPIKPIAKKISLKQESTNEDKNDNSEAISLSVEDTLDMFDNDRPANKNRRQNPKGKHCFLFEEL